MHALVQSLLVLAAISETDVKALLLEVLLLRMVERAARIVIMPGCMNARMGQHRQLVDNKPLFVDACIFEDVWSFSGEPQRGRGPRKPWRALKRIYTEDSGDELHVAMTKKRVQEHNNDAEDNVLLSSIWE